MPNLVLHLVLHLVPPPSCSHKGGPLSAQDVLGIAVAHGMLLGVRARDAECWKRCGRNMATVLIADDDLAIRSAVRATLEFAGHTVREATDGVEALAALRESQTPLVTLVDLRMPSMDGFTLLKTVTEERTLAERHVYVVFTADTSSLPVVQALRSQTVVASISKPFDLDALLQVVGEAAQMLPPDPSPAPSPASPPGAGEQQMRGAGGGQQRRPAS